MEYRVTPAASLRGHIRLPGDKSISHRYAMIAAVAEGASKISNYSSGADCHSTLGCLRSLGIGIEVDGSTVTVHGQGLDGFQAPAEALDAGNSGSTIRFMRLVLNLNHSLTFNPSGPEIKIKRKITIKTGVKTSSASPSARD